MCLSGTFFIKTQVSFFTRFFLVCLTFILFSTTSKAQAPGMLEFQGRTVKDSKPLPGAIITVYRGGTIQQQQIKTGKNGKFHFNLVFGVDYKITFSYPGCVDMFAMVYTGKLPKEKTDIFPLYETDVPFFETTTNAVRIEKYKEPFAKIIYDGKKAFMDDESYFEEFTKDIIISTAEQNKIFALKEDKEAKEKAEKEKLEASEKAKKEEEEKLRLELESNLLAEQKGKEAALARAAELARLKEEAEQLKQKDNDGMETAAIHLQREKEKKGMLAKKNKEIKTNYENDLLKMVADNERLAKEKAFKNQKLQARANTIIEQMRKETELKAMSNKLMEETKLKQKKTLENQQYKNTQLRKLVEAAAFAERSVRINNQITLPDVNDYKKPDLANVAVTVDEGTMKKTRTTVVTKGKKMDTYKKETYFWGTVYYYKNAIEIEESIYNKEISFYSGY